MSAPAVKSEKMEAAQDGSGGPVPMSLEFKGISEFSRSDLRGLITLDEGGLRWAPAGEGRPISIPSGEIEGLEWSPLGGDCRFRIYMTAGEVSFRGFALRDFNRIGPFCKERYGRDPEVLPINTTGHNYGAVTYQGNTLRFMHNEACSFEIPLSAVSQAVIQSKSDLSLLFENDDTGDADDDVLTEMRIYVPPTAGGEDVEKTAVQAVHEDIVEKAGIRVNAAERICQFEQLMLMRPRGKYDIDMHRKFFKISSSSMNYKVNYSNITTMFLLPSHDGNYQFFIIGLEKPIRQGRTSYEYLIVRIPDVDEKVLLDLNLDEKEIEEKYRNALRTSMQGQLYDLIWRVFKNLSGKKVIQAAKEYKSYSGTKSVSCSLKTQFGHLFVLKKSFFFIINPPTYIRHAQIASVEFTRIDGNSTGGRVFDIVFDLYNGDKKIFTNIVKDDFKPLFEWIKSTGVRIKNIKEATRAGGSRKDKKKAVNYTDDPYMAMLDEGRDDSDGGSADDDDEDEDEDFVAEDESSIAEDYDEDVDSSDGDDDDEGRQKRKERAKEMADRRKSKKEKKKRAGSDDEGDRASSSRKKSTASPAKIKGPKRNRSAFDFFNKAKRKQVASEDTNLSFAEIGKRVGQMWAALSAVEKGQYVDLAAEDKKRYASEKKQFDLDHPELASRKRKKKDKNAPKRAKSGYMYFCDANRGPLREANPDKSMTDIAKLLGAKWKEIGSEEKKQFEEKAAADKERYASEKAKYDEEHKDDPIEYETSPKASPKRRRKKDKDAPKRAMSAYTIFMKQNRKSIADENPDAKNTEIMGLVSAKWKTLDDEAKAQYVDAAAEDKERYKSQLAAYKAKKAAAAQESMDVDGDSDDEDAPLA